MCRVGEGSDQRRTVVECLIGPKLSQVVLARVDLHRFHPSRVTGPVAPLQRRRLMISATASGSRNTRNVPRVKKNSAIATAAAIGTALAVSHFAGGASFFADACATPGIVGRGSSALG